MKSWLHNISESYIYETLGTRRDLKEHYNLLTEQEKFALLSENALLYLDEQLKTAYGFGILDLTEEELGSILSSLLEYMGPERVRVTRGEEAGKKRERDMQKIVGIKMDRSEDPSRTGTVASDPTEKEEISNALFRAARSGDSLHASWHRAILDAPRGNDLLPGGGALAFQQYQNDLNAHGEDLKTVKTLRSERKLPKEERARLRAIRDERRAAAARRMDNSPATWSSGSAGYGEH